jgi:hypothetical protein
VDGVTSSQVAVRPVRARARMPALPVQPLGCSQRVRVGGRGAAAKMERAMEVVGPW